MSVAFPVYGWYQFRIPAVLKSRICVQLYILSIARNDENVKCFQKNRAVFMQISERLAP